MNNTVLKKTFTNIKRSGWRAYAVIFMMTVTYLILGFLMITVYTSNSFADYLSKRPEVIGFFKEGVTEEQILQLKREFENFDYVSEIKYVSKEEAMQSFIDQSQDNKEIVEAVTTNPFPAHLNVRVSGLDKIQDVSDKFRSSDLVSDVRAYEKVLSTLKTIIITIQIVGGVLFLVFSVSTAFIIFLTIGITIYSRKNEIVVMKLVGASDSFVGSPYYLQSVIYSLIAVLMSILILVPLLLWRYNSLVSSLLGLESYNLSVNYLLIGVGIEVAFGLILAIASSHFAARRYINH